MPNESSERLERSPLQFVLVQVRFSPVAAMANYVPEFQDKLRKSGFPGFDKETTQQITFAPEPKMENSLRWRFSSRDKREAVVLTQDFVVFETTAYDVFATFTRRFQEILSQLKEVAEISYASQIGLRYIDVITALDSHEPAWFIRNEFHGLSSDAVQGCEVSNQFLSVVKTSEGTLKLKSLEGHGPGFMPPDLEASELEFDLQLAENDSFRVLDFDHITKAEVDFNPSEIIDRVVALHDAIKLTFKGTVTKEALKTWQSGGAA